MRLRKNFKRAAAAALALSISVSAAVPASAGYRIDMSDTTKVTGDVTIEKDKDDKITIRVNDTDCTDQFKDDEENDDITITGDNTGAGSAAAEENDSVESANAMENAASSAEAPEGEDTAQETNESPDEDAEESADGNDMMDILGKDDTSDDAPADTVDAEEETGDEAETSVEETEDGTCIPDDTHNIAAPDAQLEKTEAPEIAETEEDAEDEDAKTYEVETSSTAEKITNAFAETARNVIKIINNSAENLKVTLKDLTVDAGARAENAMTVSGSGKGGVTLEVDGDNTLTGGSGLHRKYPSSASNLEAGDGLHGELDDAMLTITDSEGEKGTLEAVGGSVEGDAKRYYAGNGIVGESGSRLTITNTEVTAKGGDVHISGETGSSESNGGCGIGGTDSKQYGVDKIENATVTAKGGDVTGNVQRACGGAGISQSNTDDESSRSILNSKVTATGGNAWGKTTSSGGTGAHLEGGSWVIDKDSTLTAKGGDATGGDASRTTRGGKGFDGGARKYDVSGSVTAIGGNAEANHGTATGGDGFYYEPHTVTLGGLNAKPYTSTLDVTGTINAAAGKGTTQNGEGFHKDSCSAILKIHENGAVNIYREKSSTDALIKDSSRRGYTFQVELKEGGTLNGFSDSKVSEAEDGTFTVSGEKQLIQKEDESGVLHHYKRDSEQAPTCLEDGKIIYRCTDEGCDAVYEEKSADATGHTYGEWVVDKEATCTEKGLRHRDCANCDDTQTEEIPAKGHAWSEWVVDKEATCTEAGSKHRTCANGGESETEEIPAKGHAWSEWVVDKEATCTEAGSKHRTCANGGETETEEIPAKGHVWGEWTVVKQPTTSEEGEEQRVCKNDPSHVESRTIAKLPRESTDAPAAPDTETPVQSSSAGTGISGLEVRDLFNQDVSGNAAKVEQSYDSESRELTIHADMTIASLTGTLKMLDDLHSDGVETVVFSSRLGTTALDLNALIAKFGRDADFRLVHTGPVFSRKTRTGAGFFMDSRKKEPGYFL